jgi:peptidoglycan/LPS O-acetylase OafA/YrhL
MHNITERHNNFDFLRLLFSSLVIISHAYPLSGRPEILEVLTGKQLTFGSLAVDVFFVMSGYLIFSSLKFSKSVQNYLWKRVLRLFPALIVLLIFTLLVLPFFYSGANILQEKTYLTYLPNTLSLYKVQHLVDNVFMQNAYAKTINGSLWSLSYEFTMYLFIAMLFGFRTSKVAYILLFGCFFTAYLLYNLKPDFLFDILKYGYITSAELYRLAAYFIMGSLLTFVDLKPLNNNYIRLGLFILLCLSLYFSIYKFAAPIFLPFLIISSALAYSKILNYVPSKIGDISYGVYIYGFLVQQMLISLFDLPLAIFMLLSLLVTYILSFFSWHLVEKKCLKYKNFI